MNKSCPFCGNQPLVWARYWHSNQDYAWCDNSKCPMYDAQEPILLSAWNTRDDGWILASKKMPEEGTDLIVVVKGSGNEYAYQIIRNYDELFWHNYISNHVCYWHCITLPKELL